MAKRLWHFREQVFGAAGMAGWTPMFRADSRGIDVTPMDLMPSASISSTGLDHFKPYGYLTASGAWTASDLLAYSPDVTGIADNQNVLAFFEVSSASPNWVGVGVRLAGTAGSESFYAAWLRGASGLELAKVSAGAYTALGLTVAKSFGAAAEGWFVRLEATGTTVRCRAWRWDEPEPSGWDISVTDATLTAGAVGFVAKLSDSTSGEVLNRPRFLALDEAATGDLEAPMPKTRAEVVALSEGEGAQPVFIAEMGVLGQTSAGVAQESKVCVASAPFVSSATDDPPSTAYDDVVLTLPQFRVTASEIFSGKSTQSFGDLVVASEAGVRDHWVAWNWDGREVSIWVGAAGWPRWDFHKVLTGVVAEVNVDGERLVFRLRDKSSKTARRFHENSISLGPESGNPTPFVLGEVFNADLVFLGIALVYAQHAGFSNIASAMEVRDSGVAVAWSNFGLIGFVELNSAPSGRITGDVGSVAASHHEIFTGAAAFAGITAAEIYDGAAVGNPGNITDTAPAGIYVREETTTGSVLDEIAASGSMFWWFDRLGFLRLARFEAPATTPHHVIAQDDVEAGTFRLDRLIPPSDPEFLYAAKNWTIQKDGIAGSVSESDRALYGAVGQLATFTPSYSGLDQPDNHELKRTPPARVTLYRDVADAQAEGERLHEIRRKTGGVFSVTVRAFVPTFGLGETIQLTHERLGFASGKSGLIVGLEEDYGAGRVRITFFATIDGQFPTTSAAYPVVSESEFY